MCHPDAVRRKVRILKENGYNAIRSAHNPCSKALLDACDKLETDIAAKPEDAKAAMAYSHDTILADMTDARAAADKLEAITAKEYWPFPVYSDLLFSV